MASPSGEGLEVTALPLKNASGGRPLASAPAALDAPRVGEARARAAAWPGHGGQVVLQTRPRCPRRVRAPGKVITGRGCGQATSPLSVLASSSVKPRGWVRGGPSAPCPQLRAVGGKAAPANSVPWSLCNIKDGVPRWSPPFLQRTTRRLWASRTKTFLTVCVLQCWNVERSLKASYPRVFRSRRPNY